MCGIFAVFSARGQPIKIKRAKGQIRKSLREMAYQQSCKQRHRGPDYTGIEVIQQKGIAMVHERLAIIGVNTGDQPLKSRDESIVMVANGEIYNYLELSEEIRKKQSSYEPRSDCSLIIEYYEMFQEKLFEHITGMYAFALYDSNSGYVLMARDPIGIVSMYIGRDEDRNIWVASEMKCLVGVCTEVKTFTPGTMIYAPLEKLEALDDLEGERFFDPKWRHEPCYTKTNLIVLRKTLVAAVHSHLECEVNFGALLSGGVDSSLIASIATRIQREKDPGFRLKTFSIGLVGAPDFVYSKMVADHINSDHTEVHFTIEEGLDCIREVIYKLENYDISTVRCSIPMYIITRHIKSKGIKMILSGEGSDEIFGGYLYFHQAPTTEAFHEELVKRVHELHLSDCLRANKTTMAWGVELRVPFLDKDFVNLVMSIDPSEKIPGSKNTFSIPELNGTKKLRRSRIEKHILRQAFDDGVYLPKEVLWRQKEQLSDGVGYSWIDALLQHAAAHIRDEDISNAEKLYPINTPTTKEAFYYRAIFEEYFPGDSCARTVKKWVPRTDWGCSDDPSGRKQAQHTTHQ